MNNDFRWDECSNKLSVSQNMCGMLCAKKDNCFGFYGNKNNVAHFDCRLCVSSNTQRPYTTSPDNPYSTFYSYNYVAFMPSTEDVGYSVHFPKGLYDGQVLVFKTMTPKLVERSLFFMTKEDFDDNPQPYVDFYIRLSHPTHPKTKNKIIINKFNTKKWTGPEFKKDNKWYFYEGKPNATTVIFVRKTHYTVYIDGKIVKGFQRYRDNVFLEDVKHLRILGFPWVRTKMLL